MSAIIIHLPRTAYGRGWLRDALADATSAEFRLYLATEVGWDDPDSENDPAMAPPPPRERRR
jgi:hypothetical protein